jgi:isopentenyl-diphosphate delta-isomerase type 1
MEPSEIDQPEDVAAGTVPGVKNAAIRKLQHELGMTFSAPPDMKFLTRLHYWASDTVTHGATAPWGEHEIDYVLFLTVAHKEEVVLTPHPDEVDAVKWVNPVELQAMLDDTENLLLSPWFRLICHKWLLPLWWKDLEGCMVSGKDNKYTDYDTIHEFDPPTEHLGGGGNAGTLFGGDVAGDTAAAIVSGDSRYVQTCIVVFI